MFAVYAAISVVEPFLLWGGGKMMDAIFGFGSHWSLGVFIAASVVGAGGFMTIVGRERTRLAVAIPPRRGELVEFGQFDGICVG